MERVAYEALPSMKVGSNPNVVSIGKPPWSNFRHTGRLERLILQLGSGKGKFSEAEGIPRSVGCLGNNRFPLRDEPLGLERMKGVIMEFRDLNGKELWLTNYDNVDDLVSLAAYAYGIGIPEVYAVVLLEDLPKIEPVDGVRFVAELEYSPENMVELESYPWLYGALVTVRASQLDELLNFNTTFSGEIYVDLLYPGSARWLDFNVIEVKRVLSPTTEKYHDCLAGTVAVTAEGYVLPCPLLRNYVVADLRKMSLKRAIRKKLLRDFWKMTKDRVEACATCPFKYICHDCRALEYQATGDINGLEYCSMDVLLNGWRGS